LQFWNVSSRQPEVANFEITIRVNEEISRLEVSVIDASGMDVLQATEDLVEEELHVIVRQGLVRLDDLR